MVSDAERGVLPTTIVAWVRAGVRKRWLWSAAPAVPSVRVCVGGVSWQTPLSLLGEKEGFGSFLRAVGDVAGKKEHHVPHLSVTSSTHPAAMHAYGREVMRAMQLCAFAPLPPQSTVRSPQSAVHGAHGPGPSAARPAPIRCGCAPRLAAAAAVRFVRPQSGATASAGQKRGDVEVAHCLQVAAGRRNVIFGLRIAHDRCGIRATPSRRACARTRDAGRGCAGARVAERRARSAQAVSSSLTRRSSPFCLSRRVRKRDETATSRRARATQSC